MEKSEKVQLRNNSSVPDVVFCQLRMEKDERVIGFIDNDSEEHFGKLSRKGGEILLPGVFPQKSKLPEDVGKGLDGHSKKGKLKVRVDVPTSDTELESILYYNRSSSSDLKFLKSDEGRVKVGICDGEMTVSGANADKEKAAEEKDKMDCEVENLVAYPKESEIKTFLKKSNVSGFSNDSQFSRSENCECCEPRDHPSVHVTASESVLQTQQLAEDKDVGDDNANVEAQKSALRKE